MVLLKTKGEERMVDSVVFDLDDTLYDQLLPFKNAFEMKFKQLSHVPVEKLYISSRKHSDAMFDKSEDGTISLLELHTYRIIAACKEFGIEISHAEAEEFQEIYQNEQQKIALFPDIIKLLDLLLNRNIQLAILTNGPFQHQLMKIKQLQLMEWIPKENLFISEAIGSAKPNPNAFLFVEKKLNLTKSKTVYIGDSFHKDIVGARQVGWKTIWMNHRKKPVNISSAFAHKIIYSPQELLSDKVFRI